MTPLLALFLPLFLVLGFLVVLLAAGDFVAFFVRFIR